jgi:hypothetical protein
MKNNVQRQPQIMDTATRSDTSTLAMKIEMRSVFKRLAKIWTVIGLSGVFIFLIVSLAIPSLTILFILLGMIWLVIIAPFITFRLKTNITRYSTIRGWL